VWHEAALLDWVRNLARASAIAHVRRSILARRASPIRVAGYSPALAAKLAEEGIDRLYLHQAEAVNRVRAGENVVVVTGTASGKASAILPVLEALEQNSEGRSLFLFPTKALAQDQQKVLERLLGQAEGARRPRVGVYDGDTPQTLRTRLRDEANVLLTNPDMLHSGILPHHARWSGFFSRLSFVVVDEIHVYRGVFGSHVANVLRRLRRICQHYGADPIYIASSATIGIRRAGDAPVGRARVDGRPGRISAGAEALRVLESAAPRRRGPRAQE
jgi:DEAD/DEAH box helicase domain-containing protein